MDIQHWRDFAAGHKLLGYTYPVKYFDTKNYTEEMLKTGIMLFVHTVDDPDDIQRCYDAGITAVYSDLVN